MLSSELAGDGTDGGDARSTSVNGLAGLDGTGIKAIRDWRNEVSR